MPILAHRSTSALRSPESEGFGLRPPSGPAIGFVRKSMKHAGKFTEMSTPPFTAPWLRGNALRRPTGYSRSRSGCSGSPAADFAPVTFRHSLCDLPKGNSVRRG